MDGKTIDGDDSTHDNIFSTKTDQEAMQIFKILHTVVNNVDLCSDDYENYESIIENFVDLRNNKDMKSLSITWSVRCCDVTTIQDIRDKKIDEIINI
jgi:hypothetical protein